MNKSVTSSLLGASKTRLPRSTGRARTCPIRAQQSVTMIATMALRLKAQTPEAQRMARKSFPLAPSCRRGRRQPSKGPGQPRMPHIAARPAPLQRPATSPDAPLRKGSKLAFNERRPSVKARVEHGRTLCEVWTNDERGGYPIALHELRRLRAGPSVRHMRPRNEVVDLDSRSVLPSGLRGLVVGFRPRGLVR